MLVSHLGRPNEGEYSEEASLKPVAKRLSELLGKEVGDEVDIKVPAGSVRFKVLEISR